MRRKRWIAMGLAILLWVTFMSFWVGVWITSRATIIGSLVALTVEIVLTIFLLWCESNNS